MFGRAGDWAWASTPQASEMAMAKAAVTSFMVW
jgi:hypothetical protein